MVSTFVYLLVPVKTYQSFTLISMSKIPRWIYRARPAGLPTTPFPKVFNHLAQALCPVLPVFLDGPFRTIRITLLDATDYGQVLVYRNIQTVHDGTGIETPISFGLRLDPGVDGTQAWPRTRIHDSLVKGNVEIKYKVRFRSFCCRALLKFFVESP